MKFIIEWTFFEHDIRNRLLNFAYAKFKHIINEASYNAYVIKQENKKQQRLLKN
jgi:hypothetical protein